MSARARARSCERGRAVRRVPGQPVLEVRGRLPRFPLAEAAASARIVRGGTPAVRNLGYDEAARIAGMSDVRIMVRRILPNAATAEIVFATADTALTIPAPSSASFLGLGAPPPNPEWGPRVAEARGFFPRDRRPMTWPGLAPPSG